MRMLSKYKSWLMMAVLAFAVVASGITAEAKIISKKGETYKEGIYRVGAEVSFSGSGFKINGKSLSKMKKKVKSVKTSNYSSYTTYHTKAYFDNIDAYSQYDDYRNAYTYGTKSIGRSTYQFRFLKAGTYKISYASYSSESLSMVKSGSSYKLKDNDGKLSSELYERKYLEDDGYYYQSGSKIYASGKEGLVAASIKKGADGKNHLYYQPRNLIKTTNTYEYKVLKSTTAVSSVQLGKAKLSYKDTRGSYSTTTTSSRKQFLSGSKGKVTAKTGDKNYSVTNILVLTLDKDGNLLAQVVGNKKNVVYGTGKGDYTITSANGSVTKYSPMYKPTMVYVGYKNKYTGAFTKFDLVKVQEDGQTVTRIKSTYRYEGDTKDREYIGTSPEGSCVSDFLFYKK